MSKLTEDNTTSMENSDITHDGAPVTTCQSRDWFLGNAMLQINRYVASWKWKVIGPIDEIISHGHGHQRMHALEFFMWMSSQTFLSFIATYTNAERNNKDIRETARSQILKHFCILVLMTRREFSDRRSLWSPKHPRKYLPPPNFGHSVALAVRGSSKKLIAFLTP